MNKILITGAAGFIGSNFTDIFHKEYPHAQINLIDKLTYAGFRKNLYPALKEDNVHLYYGDICDGDFVKEIMKGCDLVVNFAAETHVDRSLEAPSTFLKTNVLGTYQLLEAAREAGVNLFLQISTDEVYGSLPEGTAGENSPLKASNPYAATKASADQLSLSYYKSYQLPVVITRSSNTYGPRQYPEKIIPRFIKLASRNQEVPVYGNGKNIRDWLYVKDACKAYLKVIEKGEEGEIYNISAKERHTNIKLTKMLLDELNKPEELISFVEDRPGHDYRYAIDNKKIRELGWSPEVSLEEGLKKTVNWYQNNPYLFQVNTSS